MNDTPPNAHGDVMELIALTDGLTLSQVCSITGLEGSTIQNWIKRGFVPRPVGKRYTSRQLARIQVIAMLRDSMRIEQIGELMAIVNGDTDDTADDIISEEELLGCLREAVGLVGRGESVDAAAEKVSGIVSEEDKPRLTSALRVMILARIASDYRNLAETKLRELQSKYLKEQ